MNYNQSDKPKDHLGFIFITLVVAYILIASLVQFYQSDNANKPSDISASSDSTVTTTTAQNTQFSPFRTPTIIESPETRTVHDFIDKLWNADEIEANKYLTFGDPNRGVRCMRNIRRILEIPGTTKPARFDNPIIQQAGRLAQVTATVEHGQNLHTFLVRNDGRKFDLEKPNNRGLELYYEIVPQFANCPKLDYIRKNFLNKNGIVKKRHILIRGWTSYDEIGIYMNVGKLPITHLVAFDGIMYKEQSKRWLDRFGLKIGDTIKLIGEQVTEEKEIVCNLIKTSDGWKIKEIFFLPYTYQDGEIMEM